MYGSSMYLMTTHQKVSRGNTTSQSVHFLRRETNELPRKLPVEGLTNESFYNIIPTKRGILFKIVMAHITLGKLNHMGINLSKPIIYLPMPVPQAPRDVARERLLSNQYAMLTTAVT
jgi:hypothetical protein